MVTYGDSGYYISVSTAINGADSETVGPDETKDIIYFWAESYKPDRQNKDKMKEMANNNSYNNRMGKMARRVDLTKCILLYDDTGEAVSNTQSYNRKITLLDSWCAIDSAAVYLIIASKIDNVNVALSRITGTTPRYALKCALKRISTKPVGNVYMVDLAFKETSLY